MTQATAVFTVFTEHWGTNNSVRKLAAAGIDIKNLSIVDKGYTIGEKAGGL